MGLFCVNFHFRTKDDKAVSDAVCRRGVRHYRVAPANGSWTSLYEERASEQDDQHIRDLARGLSDDLHVAVIAFLVHDSDIACYWLYENGQQLDEYNSDPDYFGESDGPPSPSGGRPDVLVRYCRQGVGEEDLTKILSKKNVRATTFAEHIIQQLARALGINVGLAIADYRDSPGDDEPDGMDDEGPSGSPLPTGMMERLAKRFGFDMGDTPVDPQAQSLVQAAATGDIEAIDRLLAAGANVEAEAPSAVSTSQMMAGLAQLFPAGLPQLVMTPLHAAVVNKQRRAVERLLEGGADPNRVHARYGTSVHAAVGAGNVELLQLLIDRGGHVNARNAQGQTPLQILAASRAALDRVLQMQATMKSMGINHPGVVGQLAKVHLPAEGWDNCERLLKEHGAH